MDMFPAELGILTWPGLLVAPLGHPNIVGGTRNR